MSLKDTTEEETQDDADVTTEADSTSEIDWKARAEELETVTKRQAGALREERQRRKDAEASDDTDDSDSSPTIRKELDRIERMRIDDTVEEQLEALVTNADKRKVVRDIYENRLNKSGYSRSKIKEDLETALLIADPASVEAKAERKAKKDLATKQALDTASRSPRSITQDSLDGKKYTRLEKGMLRAFGVIQ